jgi:hypothetical protein
MLDLDIDQDLNYLKDSFYVMIIHNGV